MTHQRRKLKPWVIPLALAILGALAFLLFRVVDFGESSPEHYNPPTYGVEEIPEPSDPTVASEKVCSILDGAHIDSREEQNSLDERVYPYYSQLVDENGILAGFAEDLHNPETRIGFLNELLADDVAKECGSL